MGADVQATAERDIAWLATRQPAVIRLLERELLRSSGEAFAAGLELAWSLLGGDAPWAHVRLGHAALAAGMSAVRREDCSAKGQDAPLARSIRDQIADLPIALSRAEQDAVVTVIAAVTWATLDAVTRGVDDTLVATSRPPPL